MQHNALYANFLVIIIPLGIIEADLIVEKFMSFRTTAICCWKTNPGSTQRMMDSRFASTRANLTWRE